MNFHLTGLGLNFDTYSSINLTAFQFFFVSLLRNSGKGIQLFKFEILKKTLAKAEKIFYIKSMKKRGKGKKQALPPPTQYLKQTKEVKMIYLKLRVMGKYIALLIFAVLFLNVLYSQRVNFKQKAIEELKKKHYTEAISLLKKASIENPEDAEIYYYLGRWTHYLCYNIGPRKYNEDKSNKILKYLNKAVSLNPHLGNAYYYIGVEYGMRGHFAMIDGNIKKARKEFQMGREKGGYPDWLIEYAQNILKACKRNAILFTGGDAEANSLWYLQLVKDYRTDVSVIPLGLLNFTPFVLFAKKGLDNLLAGIPISKTNKQMKDMRPIKWKTKEIKVAINKIDVKRFNIPENINVMKWELKPDILKDTLGFLMPSSIYILDIVRTNKWKRPIYFTIGSPQSQRASLNSHLQLCGLVYRLFPVETEKYGVSINFKKIESILLNPENYIYFKDIKEHNMPRVSFILNNYRVILMEIAKDYLAKGNKKKAKDILYKMKKYMPDDVFPIPEKLIENIQKTIKNGG